jgi:hypothetical protein
MGAKLLDEDLKADNRWHFTIDCTADDKKRRWDAVLLKKRERSRVLTFQSVIERDRCELLGQRLIAETPGRHLAAGEYLPPLAIESFKVLT